MNDSHQNFFSKLHFPLLSRFYSPRIVSDPFLKKKISDYYMSRLIPDFFYHTPLSNNYYPTIVATRVTLSLTFFFLFSYVVYRRRLADKSEKPKKYSFGLFTNKFIQNEKDLILNEKLSKRKIIFN